MEKIIIQAQPRKITGRKVKNLRSEGLLPANIFGKKISSLNIQVKIDDFNKTYRQAGESSLVYLQVEKDKEVRPVFISQVTRHPVTDRILHTAFHQVDLKEKVTAPVPVELIGEAPAEKEKIGIMVQQLDELDIEALPTDMPENIKVDVSGLSTEGANIKVGDLKLDSKLKIETDPESIIVKIEALAKEEVEPVVVPVSPAEGEATPAEVETEKAPEDKKEEPKKE